MTHVEVRCKCGGQITFEPLADVPPPPMPILDAAGPGPDEWHGWIWVCSVCGENCGVTYDYGTLDLGIVRDSDLRGHDFEIFDGPPGPPPEPRVSKPPGTLYPKKDPKTKLGAEPEWHSLLPRFLRERMGR